MSRTHLPSILINGWLKNVSYVKMSDIVKGKVILVFLRLSIICNFFIDVGKIWDRLFDHKPFLSGEINFVLREFEV